jgi:regulator of sirC expression with transglutaminase-like and TPR domain
VSDLNSFAEMLAREETRIDLAHACLMIAEDAYPELDAERYLGELERMALRLRASLAKAGAGARSPADSPEDRVMALNQFLFRELGYRGNTEEYYDPRNSYLNEVMDRRTGIPITLGVLYMTLGRRIGLPLEGVSFPGHFLVRLRLRGGMLVLDPFDGGAPLGADDLRARLERVVPKGLGEGVRVRDLPLEQFLEPASTRQILARVLRNLKGIYREADQPDRLLAVLNRMLLVAPGSTSELRDRGLVYQRLECYRAALQDLSGYLEREPEAPDFEEVRVRMMEVSALCARLN